MQYSKAVKGEGAERSSGVCYQSRLYLSWLGSVQINFKRSLKSKESVSWALNIPFSGDLESLDHQYLTTKQHS